MSRNIPGNWYVFLSPLMSALTCSPLFPAPPFNFEFFLKPTKTLKEQVINDPITLT